MLRVTPLRGLVKLCEDFILGLRCLSLRETAAQMRVRVLIAAVVLEGDPFHMAVRIGAPMDSK